MELPPFLFSSSSSFLGWEGVAAGCCWRGLWCFLGGSGWHRHGWLAIMLVVYGWMASAEIGWAVAVLSRPQSVADGWMADFHLPRYFTLPPSQYQTLAVNYFPLTSPHQARKTSASVLSQHGCVCNSGCIVRSYTSLCSIYFCSSACILRTSLIGPLLFFWWNHSVPLRGLPHRLSLTLGGKSEVA